LLPAKPTVMLTLAGVPGAADPLEPEPCVPLGLGAAPGEPAEPPLLAGAIAEPHAAASSPHAPSAAPRPASDRRPI
jgi:hypothetical protein